MSKEKIKMSSCVVCQHQARVQCECATAVYCGAECANRHWNVAHRFECIAKRSREEFEDDAQVTLRLMNGETLVTTWERVKRFKTLSDLIEDTDEFDLELPNITKAVMEQILANVRDFDTISELFVYIAAINYLNPDNVEDQLERLFKLVEYRFGKPFSLLKTTEDFQAFFGDSLNLLNNDLIFTYIIPRIPRSFKNWKQLEAFRDVNPARFQRVVERVMLDAARAHFPRIDGTNETLLMDMLKYMERDTDVSSSNTIAGKEKIQGKFLLNEKDLKQLTPVTKRARGHEYDYFQVLELAMLKYGSVENMEAMISQRSAEKFTLKDRLFQRNKKQFVEALKERGYVYGIYFTGPYTYQVFEDYNFNVDNVLENTLNYIEMELRQCFIEGRYEDIYSHTTPEKYLELVKRFSLE